jgi:hypothetical protein
MEQIMQNELIGDLFEDDEDEVVEILVIQDDTDEDIDEDEDEDDENDEDDDEEDYFQDDDGE